MDGGEASPDGKASAASQQMALVEKLMPVEAFQSVTEAMKKVQASAKARSLQIKALRGEKSQLQERISEFERKLRNGSGSLFKAEQKVKELTEANADLLRKLNAEEAAFIKLKDDSTHSTNEAKLLKMQNLRMIERQVEEKNVRNELARELHKMQKEILKVQQEKEVLEKKYDELGIRLKAELEAFDRERQQFKEKHLHTLKRLQREQEQVQDGATVAQGMAADLMATSKENDQLKGLLQEQESQLRNIMIEYQRAKDQMDKVAEENAALLRERETLKKTIVEGEKELKKSAEQLRIMAEKVFQLLNQLQKLDDWKKGAVTKDKDKTHQIELLKVKADTLTENLQNTVKRNKQLHASLKSANTRMEKYRDQSREHKSKYMGVEKIRSKLSSQVTGKDKLLYKLRSQNESLANKLRLERERNATQLMSITKLQSVLMNQETNKHDLDNRIKLLANEVKQKESEVNARDRLVESYRELNTYIGRMRKLVLAVNEEDLPPHLLKVMNELSDVRARAEEHDRKVFGDEISLNQKTAIKKIRSATMSKTVVKKTLSTSSRTKKRASSSSGATRRRRSTSRNRRQQTPPSRRSTGSTRSTTVRIRTLFRALAKKGDGAELRAMMKSLHVDEQTVVQWISDPKELITGLRRVYKRVNQKELKATAMANEFGGQAKKLALVEAKNKKMIGKLTSTEESKTKCVMRFANVLAGIGSLTQRLMDREDDIRAEVKVSKQRRERNKKAADEEAEGEGGEEVQDAKAVVPAGQGADAATGADGEGEGEGDDGGEKVPPSVWAKDLPGVANLQLANNGIEDAEAVLIANALHDNMAVQEVLMKGNRIGDKGFVAIAIACLSQKSNITFLDMQYNMITLKGVETFATMLSEFADSSGHVLRANFESERGMLIPILQVHVRGPRLLTVDVRYNKLKPDLPEGSSKAARARSDKEADAQLLKIVNLLSRCGKHSVAHEEMLRREAEYEKMRAAGEIDDAELKTAWPDDKSKSKRLSGGTRRHKKGQSRASVSVDVKRAAKGRRLGDSKSDAKGGSGRRRGGVFTHTQSSSTQFNIKDHERVMRGSRKSKGPVAKGLTRIKASPLGASLRRGSKTSSRSSRK